MKILDFLSLFLFGVLLTFKAIYEIFEIEQIGFV